MLLQKILCFVLTTNTNMSVETKKVCPIPSLEVRAGKKDDNYDNAVAIAPITSTSKRDDKSRDKLGRNAWNLSAIIGNISVAKSLQIYSKAGRCFSTDLFNLGQREYQKNPDVRAACPPREKPEPGDDAVDSMGLAVTEDESNDTDGEGGEKNEKSSTRTATIQPIHRALLPRTLQNHCEEGSYWAVDPWGPRRKRRRTDVLTVESPKKSRKKATGTSGTTSTTEVTGKQKRGRTRKKPLEEGNSSKLQNKTSVLSSNRRATSTDGTGSIKRKVGRPQKKPLEEGNSSKLQNKTSGLSINQRPTSTDGTGTIKRKRGRPWKKPLEDGHGKLLQKISDSSSNQGATSTDGISTVKRKRGRPRKKPLEEGHNKLLASLSDVSSNQSAANIDGTGTTTGKRKRGRPRKNDSGNQQQTNAPGGSNPSGTSMNGGKTTGKRKRGRPRKRESAHPQEAGKGIKPMKQEMNDTVISIPSGAPDDSGRTTETVGADRGIDTLTDTDIEIDFDEIMSRNLNSPTSETRERKRSTASIERIVAGNKETGFSENELREQWQSESDSLERDRALGSAAAFAHDVLEGGRVDNDDDDDGHNHKIDLFIDAIRRASELMIAEPIFQRDDGDGVVILV